MSFSIELLPAFNNNYIFVVADHDLGLAMVVDPGDGELVCRELKKRDLYLALILNTHHHNDHVGGNDRLQQEFGAPVIGPVKEKAHIPGISRGVAQGDVVTFSTLRGQVIETGGHTDGSISYYFPQLDTLFCGDTLFTLGCGRLNEGNPQQMWESLKRIRALPENTLLYCGHEYAELNAAFAVLVDKGNEELQVRVAEITSLRKQGKPTVPSMLGSEKRCNPFLRADDPVFRSVLAKERVAPEDADAAAVFGKLRAAKDQFGQKR